VGSWLRTDWQQNGKSRADHYVLALKLNRRVKSFSVGSMAEKNNYATQET
jgi:hypothetical protein